MKMLFGYCTVALLACMALASPALAFAGSLGLTGGGLGGSGAAVIDLAPIVTAAVQIRRGTICTARLSWPWNMRLRRCMT
jgi:hypothetical protein